MNTDLTKIKKDITWLINQVKCFMSVFPAATTWSNKHSATTGNKYLKDTLVWDDGFIYKCLVDNNSNPTSNSFYWEKVTKGWLLQQEQADWNATGGPSFIRNKPTSLGGGSETDPVFTAWLNTDPLEPYYLASNPAGYITLEDLPTPVIPTFQQVTTAGATSTNGVTFTDSAGNTTYVEGGDIFIQYSPENPGDENIAVIRPTQAFFQNQILDSLYRVVLAADIDYNNVGLFMLVSYGGLESQISVELADEYYTNIDPTFGNYLNFKIPFKPSGDYTLATLDDITGGGSQTLSQTLALGNFTGGELIIVNDADAIQLENGSLLRKGTYDFGGFGDVIVSGITNAEDGYISGIMGWGDPGGTLWSDLNGTYIKTSVAVTPAAFGGGDIGMHTPEPGTFNYYLENPISMGSPNSAWNGVAYFLAPGNRSGWGDPDDDITTDPPVNYWRLCVLSDWPITYFTNPSSDPYNFPTTGWVPVDDTIPNNEGGLGYDYIINYGGGFTADILYTLNGDGGISRICSIGYEDMWQAGVRYVFGNSGTIRHATNGFNIIPDSSFDYTKRFAVGSLWTLDNGDTYECTNADLNAAVWNKVTFGTIPNLKQVLLEGDSSEGQIYLYDSLTTPTSRTMISGGYISMSDLLNSKTITIDGNYIYFLKNNTQVALSFRDITTNYILQLPDKPAGEYIIATLDDIPSGNYLPLAGGTMDADADILFANGSKISEGLVDAGTGGNKGIALTSVGYEFKWEAGEGYITDLTTNIVKSKIYARSIPTVNDDSTKGYGYYSYWTTFSGERFRCNDALEGNAVWEQIDDPSTFVPYTGAAATVDLGYNALKAGSLVTQTNGPTKSMTLSSTNIPGPERVAEWQDKDYIGIADITDIPTNTSQLTNDGADGVNPFITAADIPATGIQHATASGTDTYTATIAGVTSYSDADAYLIRFTNGNTSGATLNINSLGARPLHRNNDGPLLGGDVGAGGEMLCVYNSTTNAFQCIGTAPNSLFAYITNDDSVTITKGMPVYAFSGTGDRMTVKRANNSNDSTSAQTVGLVLSASIAPNQKGFILMQGLLDGLNILPTATWSDGDAVYLGATDGSITKVKPYGPNHLVYLGVVTTASNGAAGRMYVRIQNGYELKEIHDVDLVSNAPTNNQILAYESVPDLWKNKNLIDILEDFNKNRGVYFFENFLGTNDNASIATSTGVTISTTGSGAINRITGIYPNRTNQQGVLLLATGTTAGGGGSFRLGSTNAHPFFVGSGVISYEVYVNIETLSTLANRFVNVFGFYQGINTLSTANGIFFLYDEGGTWAFNGVPASPNWRCITVSASTRTVTATSVAITASAWTKLRIEVNANATSVDFYIDDVLAATNTTNIPLTTTAMYFYNLIGKSTGTTSVQMFADYLSFKQTFTTPR